MGAELTADTIPAEAGQWLIDASVSFTKGCYTGQELVARIDSRGGNVPRALHGLVLDGEPPELGTPVMVAGGPDGDRTLGEVTSTASDPAGTVGLVYVPRSVTVPDGGLQVTVGDRSGLVRRLPL